MQVHMLLPWQMDVRGQLEGVICCLLPCAGNGIQVIRFGGTCFYLLSHLTGLLVGTFMPSNDLNVILALCVVEITVLQVAFSHHNICISSHTYSKVPDSLCWPGWPITHTISCLLRVLRLKVCTALETNLGGVSSQLGIPTVLSKALRFLPALWPYTALQGELCPWQIQLAFPLFKNVSVSS